MTTLLALCFASPALAGWNDEPDDHRYQVVVNHEEQYSLWFADRAVPEGWKATGKECRKKACFAYIEKIWTDVRPLSWRSADRAGRKARKGQRFAVVINHEEQYSYLPADRKPPEGWKATSFTGTKQQCQDYIEEVWTDMRPLPQLVPAPPTYTRQLRLRALHRWIGEPADPPTEVSPTPTSPVRSGGECSAPPTPPRQFGLRRTPPPELPRSSSRGEHSPPELPRSSSRGGALPPLSCRRQLALRHLPPPDWTAVRPTC